MTTDFDTTPDDAAPTERAPARRARILFAAYPGGRPSGALLRAHAFARIFDLVHNVSTREVEDAYEGDPRVRWVALAGAIERRRRKLCRLGTAMATDFEPVVANRHNAAEAIVQAARERDADLIVVGVRSGPASVTQAAGTAAAVIESTRRSILVLPFAESKAA